MNLAETIVWARAERLMEQAFARTAERLMELARTDALWPDERPHRRCDHESADSGTCNRWAWRSSGRCIEHTEEER